MKNILLLLVTFILSSCAYFKQPVPIVPKFPDPVPELMIKCNDLKTVQGEKVTITDMLKVIVENYTLYYDCSTKVDGWHEWYHTQKEIMDNIKTK